MIRASEEWLDAYRREAARVGVPENSGPCETCHWRYRTHRYVCGRSPNHSGDDYNAPHFGTDVERDPMYADYSCGPSGRFWEAHP